MSGDSLEDSGSLVVRGNEPKKIRSQMDEDKVRWLEQNPIIREDSKENANSSDSKDQQKKSSKGSKKNVAPVEIPELASE